MYIYNILPDVYLLGGAALQCMECMLLGLCSAKAVVIRLSSSKAVVVRHWVRSSSKSVVFRLFNVGVFSSSKAVVVWLFNLCASPSSKALVGWLWVWLWGLVPSEPLALVHLPNAVAVTRSPCRRS